MCVDIYLSVSVYMLECKITVCQWGLYALLHR